jgi:hypothetical protein
MKTRGGEGRGQGGIRGHPGTSQKKEGIVTVANSTVSPSNPKKGETPGTDELTERKKRMQKSLDRKEIAEILEEEGGKIIITVFHYFTVMPFLNCVLVIVIVIFNKFYTEILKKTWFPFKTQLRTGCLIMTRSLIVTQSFSTFLHIPLWRKW